MPSSSSPGRAPCASLGQPASLAGSGSVCLSVCRSSGSYSLIFEISPSARRWRRRRRSSSASPVSRTNRVGRSVPGRAGRRRPTSLTADRTEIVLHCAARVCKCQQVPLTLQPPSSSHLPLSAAVASCVLAACSSSSSSRERDSAFITNRTKFSDAELSGYLSSRSARRFACARHSRREEMGAGGKDCVRDGGRPTAGMNTTLDRCPRACCNKGRSRSYCRRQTRKSLSHATARCRSASSEVHSTSAYFASFTRPRSEG